MDPRIVMVRRTTEYESLLAEHGTPQMAKFHLEQKGLKLDQVLLSHYKVLDASEAVLGAVPTTWRKAWVLREDIDRFRFDPSDVIMAVGWDGLVPNVAKYLTGQPVFGINPFGVSQKMMLWEPHRAKIIYHVILPSLGSYLQARTMAMATLEDGRSLVAMNEIFCGHRSHQSAKYDITHEGKTEYHSSSGFIVTTGTGLTGWALSLANAMKVDLKDYDLDPTDQRLLFLVREAWTGPGTGTSIQHGDVDVDSPLTAVSKIQDGGILFGDGIESDSLEFNWGTKVTFAPAPQPLMLATPKKSTHEL